jgi:hypothetical protein
VGQVAGLSGFLLRGDVLEHAENVAFLHDEKLFPVDLNFGAGPLAEQHAIARFYIEGLDISLLVGSAGAYGDDFALLRLLLGGIGIMPPLVLSSSWIRRTTTRSCNGRNFISLLQRYLM